MHAICRSLSCESFGSVCFYTSIIYIDDWTPMLNGLWMAGYVTAANADKNW